MVLFSEGLKMLGRKKINMGSLISEDVAQAIDVINPTELVTSVLRHRKESDVSNFSLLESQSKQPTTIEEEEENLPYEDAG
eukprot:scaffold15130_cov127-Skeletonema_dohrnii-CCMP3373.AAC.6